MTDSNLCRACGGRGEVGFDRPVTCPDCNGTRSESTRRELADARAAKREAAVVAWYAAVAWHRAADEAAIEAELQRPYNERTAGQWARLAVIALDQSGVHPGRVCP